MDKKITSILIEANQFDTKYDVFVSTKDISISLCDIETIEEAENQVELIIMQLGLER